MGRNGYTLTRCQRSPRRPRFQHGRRHKRPSQLLGIGDRAAPPQARNKSGGLPVASSSGLGE
eukprot:5471000-Alexandrium_andersonii.AAC.1